MPLRRAARQTSAQFTAARSSLNRVANLFVGLFLMFWGLYYTPPGAVYLYLNITGTIFLAGAFVCVVGGLYWKRANVTGGYLAMLMGAAGAIVPFFFLHWSENVTGFCGFLPGRRRTGLGSLIGKAASPARARGGKGMNYWLIFWTVWLIDRRSFVCRHHGDRGHQGLLGPQVMLSSLAKQQEDPS